jgi:hypothetical protein
MFKKFSTYICLKIHKMACLEGSGVPVLNIGRTVPKGKIFQQTFTAAGQTDCMLNKLIQLLSIN